MCFSIWQNLDPSVANILGRYAVGQFSFFVNGKTLKSIQPSGHTVADGKTDERKFYPKSI